MTLDEANFVMGRAKNNLNNLLAGKNKDRYKDIQKVYEL
jgi:hypothetical protein